MSNFKAGDLIRAVRDSNHKNATIVKGQVYEVENVAINRNGGLRIRGYGFKDYWHGQLESDFELYASRGKAPTDLALNNTIYGVFVDDSLPKSTINPNFNKPPAEEAQAPDWCPYKQWNDKYNLEEP